jgi:release factor glutamine methyltransferase
VRRTGRHTGRQGADVRGQISEGGHIATPTITACLREARARIEPAEAELLLLHALHGHDRARAYDRAWLYTHGDDPIEAAVLERFQTLLSRREAGEPVAYLTGRRGFWTLELETTASALIPRPETELLVEAALERIPADREARIADLGTGTGAIALALASERPLARVIAVDVSEDALALALANAQGHEIRSVEFRRGDWFSSLAGEAFDVVVSNPPYLAEDDPHLREGDLRYEPQLALSSGADGLDAIRVIVRDAPMHLRPGGWLLLEHGYEQGELVRALLIAAGFADVSTLRDLEARDRVTIGQVRV